MRREDFTLKVLVDGSDDAEIGIPTLDVSFDGSGEVLRQRLRDPEGNALDSGETDLTFRIHDDLEESGVMGVLAVTDRITGEYLLEVQAPVDDMLSFVRAARERDDRTDDDAEYRVSISAGDDILANYEKRTLLVYGPEGELLRQHSLIPSGVEI